MTPQRWQYTRDYMTTVFGQEDAFLTRLHEDAAAAGLPEISISADVGRLLMMMTATTNGQRVIEVGTLGGYSAIWLARGLKPGGKVITIELEDKHADFAEARFHDAGMDDRIEVVRGGAMDVLPGICATLPPGSVDAVFLDAVKAEYPAYWRLLRPLIPSGGLIIADNALGSDSWFIDMEDHETRNEVDVFNRLVADDPEFDAVAFPMRQGVLIGRRK